MQVAVRSSSLAFHPPGDSGKTPVLMICAGSGLAPFRGFVQERAELKKKGKELAPALLFIGCRHPERDSLYADEFSAWAKDGVVDVRYAYSKAPELSEGCKYVQDRLWKDREAVVALWKAGARVFICGSTIVGESVKDAAVRACMESRNITKEEAEKWFEEVKKERLASDVFA